MQVSGLYRRSSIIKNIVAVVVVGGVLALLVVVVAVAVGLAPAGRATPTAARTRTCRARDVLLLLLGGGSRLRPYARETAWSVLGFPCFCTRRFRVRVRVSLRVALVRVTRQVTNTTYLEPWWR